jgi:methionyl aminopeptidase
VTDAEPGSEPAAANGHATANGSTNGAAPPSSKKKGKKALKQTDPPSITVKRLFPDGAYPEGEWQPYKQECAGVKTPLVAPTGCTADALLAVLRTVVNPSAARSRMLGSCSQRWRETDEEKRALDRSNFDMINEVRQAAEVHRQVSTCALAAST